MADDNEVPGGTLYVVLRDNMSYDDVLAMTFAPDPCGGHSATPSKERDDEG